MTREQVAALRLVADATRALADPSDGARGSAVRATSEAEGTRIAREAAAIVGAFAFAVAALEVNRGSAGEWLVQLCLQWAL